MFLFVLVTFSVCFSVETEEVKLLKTNKALLSALSALKADCTSCLNFFDAAGGCEALLSSKHILGDFNGLAKEAPQGCEYCGEKALPYCKEKKGAPENAVGGRRSSTSRSTLRYSGGHNSGNNRVNGGTYTPPKPKPECKKTYPSGSCVAWPAHWYSSCDPGDCIISYRNCGWFNWGHELICQRKSQCGKDCKTTIWFK